MKTAKGIKQCFQDNSRHIYGFVAVFAMVLFFSCSVFAQTPPVPKQLESFQAEGAQVRFLGRSYGMNGWIVFHKGKEQYFYETPEGRGVVSGIMFGETGNNITLQQIVKIQKQSGDVLGVFAEQEVAKENRLDNLVSKSVNLKPKPEQLYDSVEESNWVALGSSDAPYIYTFIDPQCPHCKAFLEDLRQNYIQKGLVQVRIIPVGFREDTMAQAAFLLTAPDPETRLYRHMKGDGEALPVTRSINQQGVERNLSIMQAWKFNMTPVSIYKDKRGEVKIIAGRAQNAADLVADLP